MASRNKVIQMLGAIKTIYSYYAKDVDISLLVETWQRILSEYTDQEVETAFENCLKRCKVPPTPADVIEQIESRNIPKAELSSELWLEYVEALKKAEDLTYYFPFTFVEPNGKTQGENAREELQRVFDGLSHQLKVYIGSVGMLIEKGKRFDFDDLKYEKPNFEREIVKIPVPRKITELPDSDRKRLNE